MNTKDLLNIVSELNNKIGDSTTPDYYQFNLTTSGYVDVITVFLCNSGSEIILWNSEDDEIYNWFDVDDYSITTFKQFLYEKLQSIANNINTLSYLMEEGE